MRAEQGDNRGTLYPFVLAGLICLSPATLFWPFVFPDERKYFLTNKVDPEFALRLLPYFLASLLLVGAVYVFRFVRSHPRRLSTLVETTRSCNASLLFLLACPPIAALAMAGPKLELKSPFFTLALVAITTVIGGTAGYRWARSSADRVDRGDWEAKQRRWLFGLLGVSAAAVVYAIAFSCFSIMNLRGFILPSFDLAIYDTLVWNTSHGNFLVSTLSKGGTHMSAHFDPLLTLLSPFYLLSPRVHTLLIIQSVWLASGAIPLYLISSRVLKGAAAGMVIAGAYLVHPALHGINLYEFHSLALVVPLVIWALYFVERDNAKGYWIVLVLILLTREDMALLACGIGLFVADAKRRPLRGLTTIACALLYFALVKGFVMAESGIFMSGKGASYTYRYFFEQMIPFEGGGAKELLLTLITNPIFALSVVLDQAKLLYFALIMLPCCFLPLFARRGWELLGYGFVFGLLSTASGPHSVHTQYPSVLLPFVMVLAPYGLARLSSSELVVALDLDPRRVRRALLVAVAIAAPLVSWKFGGIIENQTFMVGNSWSPAHFQGDDRLGDERAQYDFAMQIIEKIPPSASVSVTRYLMPLVSNRKEVRHFHWGDSTDYLLVRVKSLPKDDRPKFLERSRGPKFEEVASGEGIILLKRVKDSKAKTK